jgi:hypothetical protein
MSLSKTEWFGLISGSIGLIVDVLALATLPNLSVAPTNIGKWVILFVAIAWTSVVVGVYGMVLIVRRQRSRGKAEDVQITFGATLALTLLFSIPLFVGYYATLFTQFERTRAAVTTESSPKSGDRQRGAAKDTEDPLNSGIYVLGASIITSMLVYGAALFISAAIVGEYDEDLNGIEDLLKGA